MAGPAPGGGLEQLHLNWAHPRIVNVGHAEIAVHVGGRGHPVLLLPGFPCSPRSYMPLAERLAADYHVLLPHLPGTGDSPVPLVGGFSVRENARRLLQMCDMLGVRKFHLVGHDIGGVIAFWLAARHRESIGRLVVMSAPLRGLSFRYVLERLRLGFPGVGDLAFTLGGPALIRRMYQEWAGPDTTIPQDELERAADFWAGRGHRRTIVRYCRAPGNVLVWRALRDAWLTTPALLIYGTRVPGIGRRTVEASSDAISAGRVRVLKHVGRFPHLERRDEVIQMVIEFLGPGTRPEEGAEVLRRPGD